jgi:hypothetical protein
MAVSFIGCSGYVDFSGTPFSSTNKIDRHDITEILFAVKFNNITHHSPKL